MIDTDKVFRLVFSGEGGELLGSHLQGVLLSAIPSL